MNCDIELFYKNSISDIILNQSILLINGFPHRFKEIEFYFTSDFHNDPFTHCNSLQKEFGIWYFHRTSSTSNSYKGGSYKGLDITLGNNNNKSAGGILIRSIQKISDNSIICGPSLCVDYILKTNMCSSIDNFINLKLKNNLDVCSSNQIYLRIIKNQELNYDNIIHTGRIGLYFTKKDVSFEHQQEYIFKLYRSITSPSLISKGRTLAILSLLDNRYNINDINTLLNCNINTITKYKTSFEYGKTLLNLDKFKGNRWNDTLLSECYGAVINKYPNNKQLNNQKIIKQKEITIEKVKVTKIKQKKETKDEIIALYKEDYTEIITNRSTNRGYKRAKV